MELAVPPYRPDRFAFDRATDLRGFRMTKASRGICLSVRRMAACNYVFSDLPAAVARQPSHKARPQVLIGNVALGFIAIACGWTLYTNLAGSGVEPAFASAPAQEMTRSEAVALLDPTAFRGYPAEVFTQPVLAKADRLPVATPAPQEIAALEPQAEVQTPEPQAQPSEPPAPARVAANVPLPTPRPADIPKMEQVQGPSRSVVSQANKATVLAAISTEKPNIFEKLFGKPERGPVLAYAAPDGGIGSDGQSLTSGGVYDKQTAVYDISARMVYLPNGTKLEAHSGLGGRMDDPRFVHERMRGATPPHVYDLSMREKPFHGVEAIRLTPIGGEGKIFGRTGLLAHTYMLGPRGDSNGCVSFKDYQAFLRAYKNNEIKRLVVVARLT